MDIIYVGETIVAMSVASPFSIATSFYLSVHSVVVEIDENSED